MTALFEVLLTAILCYILFKAVYYTVKRVAAVTKISELKKECGAKITRTRMPFISYFRLSAKPDLTVEIGDTVYLIRLLNGRGGGKFMHFASDDCFVTYAKTSLSLGALLQLNRRHRHTSSVTSRHRVQFLPRLRVPEEYDGKKTVPVLILNPAPNEVSYVTPERNSIKVAFTGDEVSGNKIFTASTFAIYADRMKRERELYRAEYTHK